MPVPRCSANWPKMLRSILAPRWSAWIVTVVGAPASCAATGAASTKANTALARNLDIIVLSCGAASVLERGRGGQAVDHDVPIRLARIDPGRCETRLVRRVGEFLR